MIRLGEKLFCLAAIAFLSASFFPRSMPSDASASGGGILVVQAAVYGTLLILCLIHWHSVFPAFLRCWNICLLLLLALVSASWSSAYDVTLRRFALLLATTVFGIYFGSRFERDEQLRILAGSVALLGLISVGVTIAHPGYGLEVELHLGALRGIFPHKNMLGRIMVLGFCSFLCMDSSTRFSRSFRILGALLCLILVVLSRSRDAILIGVVLWICTAIAMRTRRSTVLVVLFASIAITAAVFVLFPAVVEQALTTMGRDATLTGRTGIWSACIQSIEERPLLGYGFATFWRGLDGPSLSVIAAADWMVPHAHDGYLDLVLDLGLTGLFVFASGLWAHLSRSAAQFRASTGRVAWWPLLYSGFLLLYNLGESSILKPNSIFWALFVASVAAELHWSQETPACYELVPNAPNTDLCAIAAAV